MAEQPRLYVILGSHACRAGMLMLDHKGIPYRTVTLPTGLHPLVVRLRGFPGHGTGASDGARRAIERCQNPVPIGVCDGRIAAASLGAT